MKVETDMLKVLDFELTVPFTLSFIDRYKRLLMCGPSKYALARYVSELALVEYHMLSKT